MSPLLIQLLRRLAALALLLALLLAVAPRLLRELGVIGPSGRELSEQAARSLEAARAYGATEDLPSFQAAVGELERARDLARRGEDRQAWRAAAQASAHAIVAQRQALSGREEQRHQAEAIVAHIDRLVSELEDLYVAVTPGLDKPRVARLLSLMKVARQAGASLGLAYEQGNYRKVVDDEKGARAMLAAVREALTGAKR
jgi:hypothetical protein